VAVTVLSPSREPLERHIVEPTLLKQRPPGPDQPAPNILDLEAQLRAALLKVQYSDALLRQLPSNCSFEVIAYVAGRTSMSTNGWIEEEAPGESGRLELSGGEVFPLKSAKIDGALQLQCYVEMPQQPQAMETEHGAT